MPRHTPLPPSCSWGFDRDAGRWHIKKKQRRKPRRQRQKPRRRIPNAPYHFFDDLKLYHLGPYQVLPPYHLKPEAWCKVLSAAFGTNTARST